MIQPPEKPLPKCPKCKCSPCTYREIAVTAARFDLLDNKFKKASHTPVDNYQKRGFPHPSENNVNIQWELDEPDNIGKIEAECGGCGNLWFLRKFKTIEELITLHGYK
jgi:hypothetical protein